MSAYFTSLVIILFTNILAIPWICSVPLACNFLLPAPHCSQARVCGFSVMGRDGIYPVSSFALLHSPWQNADQTGRGNKGGVFGQIRFTAACGAPGLGLNGPDRWAGAPRRPGMCLSFQQELRAHLRAPGFIVPAQGGQESARCCSNRMGWRSSWGDAADALEDTAAGKAQRRKD